jgi:hypothetical protein
LAWVFHRNAGNNPARRVDARKKGAQNKADGKIRGPPALKKACAA